MNNAITLSKFKFNDLLPSSIKGNAKITAVSACLDHLFEDFDDRVKELLVYSRIDELDTTEINDLAWQWNVGYYEGYMFAQTLEEKRALIKNAVALHRHKGTRWSLEQIGEILSMPMCIVEWCENDIDVDMKPYEFDVFVDSSVKGVMPNFYKDVENLINNLKNVRSYMRKIQALIAWNVTQYLGVQGMMAQFGKVLPEFWKGGEQLYKMYMGIVGYGAISGQVSGVMELYIFTSDFDGVEYIIEPFGIPANDNGGNHTPEPIPADVIMFESDDKGVVWVVEPFNDNGGNHTPEPIPADVIMFESDDKGVVWVVEPFNDNSGNHTPEPIPADVIMFESDDKGVVWVVENLIVTGVTATMAYVGATVSGTVITLIPAQN